MRVDQLTTAVQTTTGMPQGLQYIPEFMTLEEEAELAAQLATLDWDGRGCFKRRQYIVKRREIDFLHDYGRHDKKLRPGPPLPDYLEPLRIKVAAAIGIAPHAFQQVITSLYRPGAGIDWHTDSVKAFGETICGVSLGSDCIMKFRKDDLKWSFRLARRSLLVIQGPARWQWQHHIPRVKELRYSITFRTLSGRANNRGTIHGREHAD